MSIVPIRSLTSHDRRLLGNNLRPVRQGQAKLTRRLTETRLDGKPRPAVSAA